MAWKCQQCGHESEDSSTCCQGCGVARLGSLVLSSETTGKKLSMRINTDVGQYLLRNLVADDAKFAANPQFHLTCGRATGTWMIQHDTKAKNPTFLNGTPLSLEPSALNEGSIITIGSDKAKLTVEMDYGN